MKKEMTCIVCPMGCSLTVETDQSGALRVSGNSCPRGDAYARAELTHPTRTLTTTVRLTDGRMLPVRSAAPIPKEMLFEAMAQANRVIARAPVQIGDRILSDLAGTGIDLIAAGNAKRRNQ